jgi:hypothetical protein
MRDFFSPEERTRIAAAVDSAPSILDEHPWFLRIVADDRVELHLTYPVEDLSSLRREVWISCGAALYNLRLAIRVTGHAVNDVLAPDPRRDGTLVASVEIVTGRVSPATTAEQELYEAIPYRHTSHDPFSLLRVPDAFLVEMEDAAAAENGWLRIVHRREVKRLLRAEARAERTLADTEPAGLERTGFRRARGVQLMTLSTDDDRPLDWVRAGMALEHALLTVTRFSMSKRYGREARYSAPRRLGFPARRVPGRWDRQVPAMYGIAATPLTGLLDLADLRGTARRWPWRSYYPEIPQMLIRVGYAAAPGDSPTPPRPLRWDDQRRPAP